MPKIIGVDPGTSNLGIAIINETDILYTHVIRWRETQLHTAQLCRIHDHLLTIMRTWQPDMIAIESFSFDGSNETANEWMQRLIGLCISLRAATLPCAEVSMYRSISWRHALIGPTSRQKGAYTKQAAARILQGRYQGWNSQEHGMHDADALGVATVAMDEVVNKKRNVRSLV